MSSSYRSRRLVRASRGVTYLLAAVLGALAALVVYAYLAPLDALESRATTPGSIVLDVRGGVLHRETAEGWRIPVTLDEVAPLMIASTIAAEDQRFRSHPGVDPIAVTRTALELPHPASGASTLTQQLARRRYLDGTSLPLPLRKAREALLAVQLEAHYSKDELLTAYLNDVYYGRGAYGVEAAALAYFGVRAANLDVAQAALLASLPRHPGAFDPADDLVAAREGQRYVLGRLVAEGSISTGQAEDALSAPLAFAPTADEPLAPHFAAYVFDELRRIRPDLADREGLIIETTLDPGLQAEALRTVRAALDGLRERDAGSAAVVVLDPRDGGLLAMVGGPDFDAAQGGQVNAALAPRQPGSTLKPLLYAAAFEAGYTPATPVLDVPSAFSTAAGPYAPVNYDLHYHGALPLRVALASSLNVPAVRTLDDLGIDTLTAMAQRLGIRSLGATEAYGLSLTLGGGEVTLLELTGAYGSFASGGLRVEPYAIERVRDQDGTVLYEHPSTAAPRVLSAEDAFLIADILSDPIARSATFGEGSALDTPFGAAVKTGTSSNFRDVWTVGFTPERVVGVWVGNLDGKPLQPTSGAEAAGPIWRAVLTAALEGIDAGSFAPPAGLERATVCAGTGLRPGEACPSPVLEWFAAGTAPAASETVYSRDEAGTLRSAPPAAAQPWSVDAGVALGNGSGAVSVLQPVAGAVLYLAPELERQEALLRAAVPPGTRSVEFRVDGDVVATIAGEDARAVWTMTAGEHEIEVVAEVADGRLVRARSNFEVRTAGGRR